MYCSYPKGSKKYLDFWKEQFRRCNEGYISHGYRITGDNYFFLNFYRLKDLDNVIVFDNPSKDYNSNFWLTTILIDPKCGITPDEVRIALNEENIETRLLWRPMHMQPIYKDAPYYGGDVCEKLFEQGLCLPSGSSLTDSDIKRVIEALRKVLA